MNVRNYYCFLDYETGSRDKFKTQPTQLGAVIIDPRKLEIVPNGIFNSFIKPILDNDKAIAAGLDPIEDDALNITHITREQLESAPTTEVVHKNFFSFVEGFNTNKKTKNPWDAPIMCYFNGNNFDSVIIDRMAKLYGPWDDKWNTNKSFHPLIRMDLLDDIFRWTENLKINNTNSISMDSIREWMGINKEGAHNAIKDVFDGAFLLIKFLKLYRSFSGRIKFTNSFTEENLKIQQLLIDNGV